MKGTQRLGGAGQVPKRGCLARSSPPEAVFDAHAPSTSTSTSSRQLMYSACDAAAPAQPATSSGPLAGLPVAQIASVAGLGLAALAANKLFFEQGSRAYNRVEGGTVGQEYDAWTEEGILEYYWGEHIHLGTYTDAERAGGAFKKDFKKAKYDFCDNMLAFSGAASPTAILDVGCGFGGTSRHLGKLFPGASVNGITLSPKQVERGTQLAKERRLNNVKFEVMDALQMGFPDNTFDLVWACESGEHMPDKRKYVEEMVRVLKPGGTLVIACWCQREETPERPLTPNDKKDLQFLYDEWAHPYFISIQEFERLMEGSGKMEAVEFERLMKGSGKMEAVVSEDWTPQTIDSWRHSIWVGVVDPWPVVARPHVWYKTVREIVCLERMHQAFATGLMEYGLMTGRKMAAPAAK
ncbi:hypothetical protein FOA52_001730 [Chlamydomonas sp. UWO 241]|nr:hypothetical protein FOA52_001730 [Chlamydomonas sp. UWO 241]